jgi:uncharacterized protein (DUF1499 family)
VNDKPSLLARIGLWCGGLAFVAGVVGPVFAHFEIVTPMIGFAILALGILDAVIALICGGIALLRGDQQSRGAALGGIIAAAIVLGPILLSASRGAGLPRINDITTDLDNPPEFTQAMRLDENKGRDMSYPGAEFAEQQREGYGDIKPLRLNLPPGDAFAEVYKVAQDFDTWEITLADPGIRKIEGIDTSWLFRFKDDFVIEVRPDGTSGSLVHMRSKSRDGKGDIGANAARIAAFFAKVRASL